MIIIIIFFVSINTAMSANKFEFSELTELISESDEEPVWQEDAYTEFGKWMDGWETRRRRSAGHDWAIIALGHRSIIKGFYVDTGYFTGNHAPRFSIQAARLAENVPQTELQPGYEATRRQNFHSTSTEQWTHLRLNLFPDGGIARLRAYGLIIPQKPREFAERIDLVAQQNGGVCEEYSNAHYGHPRNLIKSGNSSSMKDGWETARRLDRPPIIQIDDSGILQFSGSEWAIFRLGYVGTVDTIEVDTAYFRGNFPDSVKVEGTLAPDVANKILNWKIILPTQKLSPNRLHIYTNITWPGPVSHIRIIINPDGGISRFRFWGHPENENFQVN
ncbi:hypothetical protein G9C98_004408 [Cotesia typhae]|uniref:Allantoicase domain-containing protein n=1 Tax=Cotesia typhae TaxID=2053667 RepID=A0A8J5R881_9HYME|nr:hypothetical protein G9C98_004408 [Cotesia typhae]